MNHRLTMANDTPENLKTVEDRDREWLQSVYRGDKEKDLTPRAVLAGMVFGGLMSLSNLYVGLKSGWGLGVDIAAVIVIFAVFKALRGIGLAKQEFGMMENTIMMTVAVAASWISSAGLVSAVPALTMLTGYTVRLVAAHAVHRHHSLHGPVHGHPAQATDDPD